MQISATSEQHAIPAARVTPQLFWGVVALSLLLAVVKRYPFLPSGDFPLGEGGLFVAFSEAIRGHGYRLPDIIQYGGVSIPFAYPPAGFYLAAFVADLTGADLLKVYRHLPIALNLLAIPGFCFLAMQYTRERLIFVCAPLLYAFMPESFIWQITGGGLPRALAAVPALFGVGLALRAARTGPSIPVALTCGVLVALAMLSHLEWGIFAALGVTTAVVTRRRPEWRSLSFLAAAGVVSTVIVAPWLALVLSRHGLAPFRASSSASQWSLGTFAKMLLGAQIFVGALTWPAILGAITAIAKRDLFAVIWAPVILLVTPRMGMSSGLAIPTALLAACGLKAAGDFIERAARGVSLVRRRWYPSRVLTTMRPALGDYAAIALLVVVSLIQLTPKIPRMFIEHKVVAQLDRPTRDAMQWIARNTDAGGRFVIVSDARFWWGDRIAEWFPYLAQRASETTAQGMEWVAPGAFTQRLQEIEDFKSVQWAAPPLLPEFVQRTYCDVGYVAMFLLPTSPEYAAFKASELYAEIYNNGQAAVFKRNTAVDAACRPRSAA
ncbi:MAG TPA: hypothetical protein VGD08_02865 [Stellaceae bacterium]|jgi:hypothetical protein